MNDTRRLIEEAFEGDSDAIRCIHEAVNIVKGLQGLYNTRGGRDALIVIGKSYFDMTLKELAELFGLNESTISRIAKRGK